ncbi:type II toxin-antitoxin system RelE/ParE family toxin [Mucilaginibacter gotjawali]|uniref:mRNA-degrading endonuclease RelE of RelBE toxin-antitoxin system n=2 Tax=Mucilaginibacter gotjawali TaxID=1550579 RepID=A0A839S994_9SPHI|nr:type II toxin-antitoxin system RelE/ParE family toxin [Mucilaginibacter gotjawali]MBB3053932.1 mRNA-degrading endonuclease RelE of RelBE toxin-antitoxin system [Mucilaginibacter gotjawali]BAU54196.1 Toxin HigB-2 [Mucilaginibacter gotjawali]
MSYSIIPTEKFKKEAKRLIKKYPSLRSELAAINEDLLKHPELGSPLGSNTYKVRVAIKSKGKGKSGGARVITYVITKNKEIYLLTIYDKAELDSIDDKALKSIIKHLNINE